MTMDPYNTLSTDEKLLVDELLFGPIKEQESPSSSRGITTTITSSTAKGSGTHDGNEEKTIISDKSFRSDAAHSESSASCSFRDGLITKSETSSSFRGSDSRVASQLKRGTWSVGDDEITVGFGSTVSGLGYRTAVDDSLKIVVPSTQSPTEYITSTYGKNKKLMEMANASRLKKPLEELSAKKSPKTAVVLKHLKNITLSTMKDDRNERDVVAALNGIHIICHKILQIPKFANNNKVVAIAITILAYLSKGSDERRELVLRSNGGLIILSCMQSFSTKETLVHEECVVALYSIVQYEGNAIQITETEQAMGIILRTMKAHKSRIAVQKACFGILLRLAHVDCDYIAKPEVFDMCISNLNSKMKGNLSLHKVGCLFWRQMVALADEDGFEIKIMIKCGVLDYLLQAMKNYNTEAYIAKYVLATYFVMGEQNKVALTYVGNNLGDIVKTVVKHKSDVDTHREAYKLLRLLRTLPSSSLKVPIALIKDEEVRQAFHRAQIDPNRLVPV